MTDIKIFGKKIPFDRKITYRTDTAGNECKERIIVVKTNRIPHEEVEIHRELISIKISKKNLAALWEELLLEDSVRKVAEKYANVFELEHRYHLDERSAIIRRKFFTAAAEKFGKETWKLALTMLKIAD